jgi:GNAT superfamily N-acetyltransferase
VYENNYYFFDPLLKDIIGIVFCSDISEYHLSNYPIKKTALCVNVSAVDKAFKGQGYGKKMYLAVIDHAGCLLSDQSLYNESLNIWVNVLPKYVNYVGYVDKFLKLKKIKQPLEDKKDEISRFFATNDPSFLKSKMI